MATRRVKKVQARTDRHRRALNQIAKMHRGSSREEHPLYSDLIAGKYTKAQLQEFLRQTSIVPLYNHLLHGRLYVICPEPVWRQRLAEVVYEEATGRLYANGVAHGELYLRMCEALGLSREEMYSVDYCAAARGFRAYFEQMCGKSFLEGVSCHMLAGEAQIPGLAGRVARALVKHYDISEEAAAFWSVHDDADQDHSDVGRELLSQFAPTKQHTDLVLQTVRTYIDLSFLMFDEIHSRVKATT